MFKIKKYKREVKELINTIADLKSEISDMKDTIKSISSQVTEAYDKTEHVINIQKHLGIDKDNPMWFEEDLDTTGLDLESTHLVYEMFTRAKKQFARANPFLKKHIVFHGGCLGCEQPTEKGLRVCFGCGFFDWMSEKPYLNK